MKKIISCSLALGIFSSAVFIPYSSVSAASVANAESLLKTAETYAGTLKWQISYEKTKEIKTPDLKTFNATKSAYFQAQKEITQLNGTDKQKLEKRLEDNVGVHYTRTMGYIDAVTSGNKIANLTEKFKQLYSENPLAESTEKTYHELSAEIRKQAKLLYKVYGKSTRDAFLSKYKAPAELLLDEAKYTISANNALGKLNTLIVQKASAAQVEKQVNELFNSLDLIADDDIYYSLFDLYSEVIRKDASFIEQEKELNQFFVKTNELFNSENVEAVFNLYSSEYPDYEYLKEDLRAMFDQVDVKYELLDMNVYSIIDGYAYIEVTEAITEGNDSETVTIVYLMKKENNEWKYVDIYDSY